VRLIRARIGVIARTACYTACVGFVEDPHLQQPQRHPRQRHADPPSVALRRKAAMAPTMPIQDEMSLLTTKISGSFGSSTEPSKASTPETPPAV
jgi:hypothetical protein